MPQVILFDLGGVVMEFAGFRRLQSMVPDLSSDDQLQRRWLTSPAVRDYEVGVLDAITFASHFVSEWNLSCTPSDFLAEFGTWARGFYPGVLPRLKSLRADYQLACLSNCNQTHLEVLRAAMDTAFPGQK